MAHKILKLSSVQSQSIISTPPRWQFLPPNKLLIVESLALPDFMVEIEAVAVLD